MSEEAARPSPAALPAVVVARRAVEAASADEGLTVTGAALQRVCRGAVEVLAMRGCVIHVVGSGGASGVAATSDGWSAEIADLAFTLGEGPSGDAVALRRPVLVGDLTRHGQRWPGFTQAAGERLLTAVFTFPLLVGGTALGALELYVRRAHTLRDEETALALAFTELAIGILLGDDAVGDDGAWEPLLHHRAEVHQAQGMVMVDLGVDLAEALVRMRAHAFAEGITVIDLARAIIAGLVLSSAGQDEMP